MPWWPGGRSRPESLPKCSKPDSIEGTPWKAGQIASSNRAQISAPT
ncbi:hypothetical protein AVEN_76770-1, partial [Araneus ventricosus]